ncbi:MAG: hypothetical protein IH840_15330 [Candidatus Heimdallarchaeota archaeon]|nr:hypothetical protein [Candidatus Heimdallarchaeota archaeon]
MSENAVTADETIEFNDHKISELILLKVSTVIGIKTILNSKKWLIYLIIAFLPLIIVVLVGDPLIGEESAEEAFISFFLGFVYIWIFAFGVLLIVLPLSSDEISDHITDLYLVRPIRRETYWFSRVIATNVGVFSTTLLIALVYFLFFNLFDKPLEIIDNIGILVKTTLFVFFASIVYSGLYLLVTSTKKSGFTYGIMFAVVEQFFLPFLFLADSRYIPKNVTLMIADSMFTNFDVQSYGINPASNFTFTWAYQFAAVFTLLMLILGGWYYRRREFN